MNALKVLSRCTSVSRKLKNQNSNRIFSVPVTSLPINPQLFGETCSFGGSVTSESLELSNCQSNNCINENNNNSNNNYDDLCAPTCEDGVVLSHSELLPLDECIKILKVHKIKICELENLINGEDVSLTCVNTHIDDSLDAKASSVSSVPDKHSDVRHVDTLQCILNRRKPKHLPLVNIQPLTKFAHLCSIYGISQRLFDNIVSQGYKTPTEIQLATIPLLLNYKLATLNTRIEGSFMAVSSNATFNVNLLAIAPTGSGKTLAYLIPIIQWIIELRHASKNDQPAYNSSQNFKVNRGPVALILAPTRELASQISNEARKLCTNTTIRVTLFRKGMKITGSQCKYGCISSSGPQELFVKSQIIVSTPLTLQNALRCNAHSAGRSSEKVDCPDSETENELASEFEGFDDSDSDSDNAIDKRNQTIFLDDNETNYNSRKDRSASSSRPVELHALPFLRYLVLDEADLLFEPLFYEQTTAILRSCTSGELRLSCWSATVSSSIETTVRNAFRERQTLTTYATPLPAHTLLLRVTIGLKDSAMPKIQHKLIYTASEQGKLVGIRDILRPITTTKENESLQPPFLIFTQTIARAKALYSALEKYMPSDVTGGRRRLGLLHAEMSGKMRDNIMTAFRRGDLWILITTDLLARGMDFRDINGVINYDIPTSAAAYIHRIGRTGRAGRAGGIAISYYTKQDIPHMRSIANVIRNGEKLRCQTAHDNNAVPSDVADWLINALPTSTADEKRKLKRRGVETRNKRTVKLEGMNKKSARMLNKSKSWRVRRVLGVS